jgi:glutamate 5-kinase
MTRVNECVQVSRKALMKPLRRVVIKVGSSVLTGRSGLNRRVIHGLTREIRALEEAGVEVILVSSGAISSGLKKIGLSRRPDSLSQKQALAAVGQPSLMMAYEKAFARYGRKVAQILITRDDFSNRRRYLNARNTILTLLSWRIVPVINENDTVSVDEIKFGDNDNLSAMVTNLTESQLLVNLTEVDGLFDKDPRTNRDARLICVVDKGSADVARHAGTSPGALGTGGMASKVKAAHKVALAGVPTIIANGRRAGILTSIFRGEETGTLFMPQADTLCHRKHWIAFAKLSKGEIIVDSGAEKALVRGGKSLLPSGIREVSGAFSVGDSVVVLNEAGRELAVGMVNYDSGAVRKIMGCKSSQIEARLGFRHEDEVIHRDNLVITNDLENGRDLCRWRA